MAMKRCPDCGEKYSDTYKYCPFCEEEEVLRKGKDRGGRRARQNRGFSLLTPVLIVLILLMAGLLIFLLRGDKKPTTPSSPITPQPSVITPAQPSENDPSTDTPSTSDPGTDNTPGVIPDEPAPSTEIPAASDYDEAMALPGGLTLSTTDFTLKRVGETATIRVSGGNGSYTWLSEDDGVASVDSSGKVTAISKGTINIVVTDGSKKGVCIVRCNVSGSAAVTPSTPSTTPSTPSSSTPSSSTPSSSGGLRTGSGKVANAGGGVFVRAQPNTSSEKLATLVNGNSVNIIQSAGNGWYEITFYGAGGQTVTGYMKGDYLSN